MRPTDLHFRSPKERTPGHHYEIYVFLLIFILKSTNKGEPLFSVHNIGSITSSSRNGSIMTNSVITRGNYK